MLFSKTSEVRFDFEKYADKKSITEAIDKIPYPRKGTNCGAGLDMVRTNLFEASARQGVRDVLLVITGGSSQVRSVLGSVVGVEDAEYTQQTFVREASLTLLYDSFDQKGTSFH